MSTVPTVTCGVQVGIEAIRGECTSAHRTICLIFDEGAIGGLHNSNIGIELTKNAPNSRVEIYQIILYT